MLALENSFNRVGLDHVLLVKVASDRRRDADARRQRRADHRRPLAGLGRRQSLRTYRHAPNTGSRKSWAAGDATSRAVRLALMVLQGEPGLPSRLTAPMWGFCDVSVPGQTASLPAPLG